MRRKLTEIVVTKTKSDPKRIKELWDPILPGFGLRILPSGHRSFFLMYRHAGKQRRLGLGRADPGGLPKARDRAREALRQVERNIDPQQVKSDVRKNTFAVVAADYIKEHVSKLRDPAALEQIIRRELLPAWGHLPIAAVTPQEAARLVRAVKKRGGPPAPGHRRRKSGGEWAAHHAFAAASALFNWAVAQHEYGLAGSPFDRLEAKELIGEKKPRQRVLTDAELRSVWRAASATGYPYGPLVLALLLTGQRLSDIAEMSWAEADLDAGIISIPPERMKMDAAHEVPLAPATVDLLRALPRSSGFVFSTTGGRRPFSGFSKAKAKLDQKASELAGGPLPVWTLHDLRRTFRTRLSELRVVDTVAELCIAHQRRGLHKVYDQFAYRDEKREAMERWAARLAAIVSPPEGAALVPAAEVERRRKRKRA